MHERWPDEKFTKNMVVGKRSRMRVKQTRRPGESGGFERPNGRGKRRVIGKPRTPPDAKGSVMRAPLDIAALEATDLEPLLTDLPSKFSGKCKWPLGDPQDATFGYCGRKVLDGKHYCKTHMDRGYTSYVVSK